MASLRVPYFQQMKNYTCGPAALRMLLAYYGIAKSEDEIARLAGTREDIGTQNENLLQVAESFGLSAEAEGGHSTDDLKEAIESGAPPLVNYIDRDGEGHLALAVGFDETHITLNDPTYGPNFKIPVEEFKTNWRGGFGDKATAGWMLVARKRDATRFARVGKFFTRLVGAKK